MKKACMSVAALCAIGALTATAALAAGSAPSTESPAHNNQGMTSPDTSKSGPSDRTDTYKGTTRGTDMSNSGTSSSTDMSTNGTSTRGTMSHGKWNQGRWSNLSETKVRQIQEALKDKGYDPGTIDGIMGPQTRQALRNYQRDENLSSRSEVLDHLGVSGAAGRQGALR